MRIVHENTPEQLEEKRKEQARADALEQVSWALRQLAANILRVTRGAGKSYDIGKQAQHVVDMMIAYREVAGVYPASWELDAMLSLEWDQAILDRMSEDNLQELDARQLMIRGALQIAASRLLSQNTQEAAGRNELTSGIIAHRTFWDQQRAKLHRASRKTKKPKTDF